MVREESDTDSVFEADITEHDVETCHGKIHCTLKGTARKNQPVILTYHDIGLNHTACFSCLFNHEDMQEILKHFAVCHVDAPGQEEEAAPLSAGSNYPSMEQLAETLPHVLHGLGFKSVIGLGMGAGAYVLAKFALSHPDLVEGLVLINVDVCAEGWIDWATYKLSGWTHALPELIITHLFGKEEIQYKSKTIQMFLHHVQGMNQTNLQHFLRSYNSRQALELERPPTGANMNVQTLQCHTLLVVGDNSPAVEAVVECNSKLNPTKTTLLKMADCGGMPQVDQPGKLTEALKYFIQGLGYMPSASMTRLARSSTTSASSQYSYDGRRSRSHTLEGDRSPTRRGRSHTDISMEGAVEAAAHPIIHKSSLLSC